MKFGTDLVRGLRWEHSSYKSADDPSAGSFVHRIDIHGFPQFLLWKGSELHARNGPWVGNRFSGDPEPKTNNIYMNEFVIEAMEIYYAFHLLNKSSTTPITRLTLTPNGKYTASDTRQSWYNLSMSLEECRSRCLKNCTCTAYSNTNFMKGGSGCLLWFEELMDISSYTDEGQDIYVRMPASELDESKRSQVNRVLFISIPTILTAISVLIIMHLLKKRRLNREKYPEDRPDMTSVVLMLNSSIALPRPKKPGFFTERKQHENNWSQYKPGLSSSNDFSITSIAPR
uniref:Apple domain-containing protein n=1 Tax=Daucus carota subsp. sativus TaxID=79200 RepID=A0A161ZVN8_DAUCS